MAAVCLLNNRLLDACFSLLLLLSFENPSIDGARSLLHSSTAVTTISISPGHVTDILLWPVFFFSLPPPPPSSPTVMAVSGSHEDGVNTATS